MNFLTTELPEVIIVEPDIHRDARGFFIETYHERKYFEGGIDVKFVQDNHSRSAGGTLRGLHAQRAHPQGKLIRVIEGEIFDVAVDIRRGSPTFAKWISAMLSAENGRQCFIPSGFAHGFCVVSKVAQVEYKCTDFYEAGDEVNILWSDPSIGIEWPIKSPVLSEKDSRALPLDRLTEFLPVFGAR